MTDGLTGTEMGDRLIAAVAELGLDGEYNREKFENDEVREYDPAAAATYFAAATIVDRVFKDHLGSLEGDVEPGSAVAAQLRPGL